MVVERGEIWWASLREPLGSEPGYRRPVVIVQADDFNRSALRTVIAVVLTTNLRVSGAPGNVLLRSDQTGLSRDCVANVTQLITADKSLLSECIGRLSAPLLERIEAGMRLVLDL